MRRILTPTLFITLHCLASAQDQWMGMFIGGKKVGYSSYASKGSPDSFSESVTFLDGKMLGFGMSIRITSRVWSDKADRPSKMEFDLDSGGKSQHVIATFDSNTVTAVSKMDGRETKKSIPIPEGAVISDDALGLFLHGQAPKEIYLFDPSTLSLIRCEPKNVGSQTIETKQGKTEATVIDVQDPRAPMKIFLSAKGDLIKATGPFGMEMVPLTKEEALASGEAVDIALASSIKPDREIVDSLNVEKIKLKVTGHNLGRLANDAHQTVSKDGDAWVLQIHPVQPSPALVGNEAVPTGPWLSSDIHIPSDKPSFVKLAKTIVGDSKGVLSRAEAIRLFVHGKLRANAGMGILRDADDILKSGDGVCRDHAILMATLLRAEKIPTKVVSGLVYGMGAFYYHAWVEVWTGKQWLGLDSTRPRSGLDATHIKTGEGTVGEAFTSFLLDGAKIAVLDP